MKILLVPYDNGTYMTFFPQGLGYISRVLEDQGYEVDIWQQDIHHYPPEEIISVIDNGGYEAVGIGLIGGYWQYKMLKKLSDAISKCKTRDKVTYVLAGYGPAPEPEYFLRKMQADVCVLGEGELTAVELFDAIANNKSFENIKGIAYLDDDDQFKRNLLRELIQDVDSIKLPAFNKFPIDVYRLRPSSCAGPTDFVMPVLSGRGCTFRCNFCYRMDSGWRPRGFDSIIEEVNLLREDYGITYIIFNDDLLMTSKPRTIALMEAFIKSNKGKGLQVVWSCNARLNFATPEILKLMREAGCVFNNYGIESFDNEIMKVMKKGLNTKITEEGVKNTFESGIKPGLNMIWGNIGETKRHLDQSVDFLLKWDDGTQKRTIRPVTPYPGSPLYYHAIENGLLDSENPCEDFYERKHVNSDLLAVNFTDLSDGEFHESLCDANKKLINAYHTRNLANEIEVTEDLYSNLNASFRGYRKMES